MDFPVFLTGMQILSDQATSRKKHSLQVVELVFHLYFDNDELFILIQIMNIDQELVLNQGWVRIILFK